MMAKNSTHLDQSDDLESTAIYLAKPYARRLIPDEGGGYVATIQEFSGCIAEGDNAVDALKQLEDAAISWIGAQLEAGQPIPEPIAFHGYSGKLALRIPRGLHKQVAEMASSNGVSINQFLNVAVSSFVGAKSIADRLIENMRHLRANEGAVWVVKRGAINVQAFVVPALRDSTDNKVRILDGAQFKAPSNTLDFASSICHG